MRKRSITTIQQISDINLTPLMDLTFILLITFIITFPLIESGIPLNLPRADAEEIDTRRALTVSLDLEGKVYLDDLPITLDALKAEMMREQKADDQVAVLIRADEGVVYGKIVAVMEVLQGARITQLGFVTQERNP